MTEQPYHPGGLVIPEGIAPIVIPKEEPVLRPDQVAAHLESNLLFLERVREQHESQ